MFRSILGSLVVLCSISAALGGIWYLLGGDFWKVTFLSVVLQVTCYIMWSSFRSYRLKIAIEREQTQRIQEFSKQGIDLQCSYCSKETYVPIRFDEDNQFECPHCENVNSIYVNVTTTQVTQPLPVARIMSNSYIKEEAEIRHG
jgi:hypothetical protein